MHFDQKKESFHVLHRRDPEGDNFRVLRVLRDTKLSMEPECEEVRERAFLKLQVQLKLKS